MLVGVLPGVLRAHRRDGAIVKATLYTPVPDREGFEFFVEYDAALHNHRVRVKFARPTEPDLYAVGNIPLRYAWDELADAVDRCCKAIEKAR